MQALFSVTCYADTLKLYTKAHGAKTMNLIINLDHDEDWILHDDNTKFLIDYGIGKSNCFLVCLSLSGFFRPHNPKCCCYCPVLQEHETEISFFNWKLYEAFKSNPEIRW